MSVEGCTEKEATIPHKLRCCQLYPRYSSVDLRLMLILADIVDAGKLLSEAIREVHMLHYRKIGAKNGRLDPRYLASMLVCCHASEGLLECAELPKDNAVREDVRLHQ